MQISVTQNSKQGMHINKYKLSFQVTFESTNFKLRPKSMIVYLQMMEYGQRSRKRPLFSCIHCKRNRTSFVNERYRMTDHVKKHHFPLNQAPFYCSLCLFRCSSREALNKHVTDYKRHAVLAAMQGGGDQSRYLIENAHPKDVQEGDDYKLAAHETSDQGQDELVNVKMTPQVFANLFKGPGMSTGTALPYTPTRPEFN